MPRMSEAEKRKSHTRILDAASEIVRDQGLEKASLSSIMKAAGMTHGGFYRHFEDKDDLLAHAFRHAVDSRLGPLEAASSDADKAKARQSYIDSYLSMEHVQNRGSGCPSVALASEIIRGSEKMKNETSESVERVSSLLAEESGDNGTARFALLLGAVTLARFVDEDAMAESILADARAAILKI